MNHGNCFHPIHSVCTRFAIGRSTLYDHIKQGIFVPPVKVGPRKVAWPQHELEAMSKLRLQGASQDNIRKVVSSLVAARTEAQEVKHG